MSEMRRHSPPPPVHLLRLRLRLRLRLLSPPPVVAFPLNSTIPNPLPAIPLGFRLSFPHFQGFDGTQISPYAAEDSGKKTKPKIQRNSKSRLAKTKKKARSRAPMTPVTSKLKKYKIKAYTSFKYRFRTLNDGTIRRWRAGNLHNAHGPLQSKKSKRRLRKPALIHPAYAKVLKKLNFAARTIKVKSAMACSL